MVTNMVPKLPYMTGYIKIPETGESVLSRKSHFSEPTQISGAAKNIILRKNKNKLFSPKSTQCAH